MRYNLDLHKSKILIAFLFSKGGIHEYLKQTKYPKNDEKQIPVIKRKICMY
jgi:hypothetical protein